jgi:hypothetical protein
VVGVEINRGRARPRYRVALSAADVCAVLPPAGDSADTSVRSNISSMLAEGPDVLFACGRLRLRLEAQSGRVLAEARAEYAPTGPISLHDGALWVPEGRTVTALDERSLGPRSRLTLPRGLSVRAGAAGPYLPLERSGGAAMCRLPAGDTFALTNALAARAVPVLAGDLVIVPRGPGLVQRLDAIAPGDQTPELPRWTAEFVPSGGAAAADADSPPSPTALHDGVLYSLTAGLDVDARTADEGTPLWSSPLGVAPTAMWIEGEVLWVGARDGTVTAYDAFAGERLGTVTVRTQPPSSLLLLPRRSPDVLAAAEVPAWILPHPTGGALSIGRLGGLHQVTIS